MRVKYIRKTYIASTATRLESDVLTIFWSLRFLRTAGIYARFNAAKKPILNTYSLGRSSRVLREKRFSARHSGIFMVAAFGIRRSTNVNIHTLRISYSAL
jgi:hypothetical protein